MRQLVIKPAPGNSASQKIERVTDKLGLPKLNQQQGTHRIIFDTLPLVVNASQNTLRFFKNVQTRQFPFSNLNQNKLDVGESMAVERVYLFLLRNSSAVLIDDVTGISSLDESLEFNRLTHSIFNIQIGTANVTKDVYFGSSKSPFNRDATYQNPTTIAGTTATTAFGYSVLRFETPFILQPDVEFEGTLQIPAISALPATGSFRLGMAWEGIGGIYNPKVNL
jgi:hypothetical protein